MPRGSSALPGDGSSTSGGRLTANRGDGALVRLSTPIEAGDVEGARPRLYGLDVAFEQAVEGAWKTADTQPALSPTG